MKLKYKFEIVKIDDTNITAVPVGKSASAFHGILKINDISAEILQILGTTTDYGEIKAKFLAKYSDQKEEEVVQVLDDFLAILEREGLLEK